MSDSKPKESRANQKRRDPDEILWQLLALLIDGMPEEPDVACREQNRARRLLDEWDKARKEEVKP